MQQLSDEWFLAHVGMLTGSKMDTVVNGGDRAWITMLDKMKAEMENPQLVLEKGYSNAGMDRGLVLENDAIDFYEMVHNVDVERPAFVVCPTYQFIACSPDFNRDKDGIVGEVKCPANENIHMANVIYGTGVETYKPQIQTEILCTEATMAHFISYDPRVKDPSKRFHMIEVERDEDYIDFMLERCSMFYQYLTTDTRPDSRMEDSIPDFF